MTYALGATVPLSVEIKNAAGVLTNATTVTLTIGLPDGTTTTPVVSNPPVETGRYRYEFVPAQPGRHIVSWTSTGPATAAPPDVVDVRPANPAYLISLSDAKQQINVAQTVAEHDDELRVHIEAVTWAVEDQVQQVAVRRSITETVRECRNKQRVTLRHYPVISLTSAARIDGAATWTVADLDADRLGTVTVLRGSPFHGDVRFTYVAGREIIPANYTLAARIIVQHLWDLQRGNAGAARFGGSDGGVSFTPSGFALPNRALQLLGGRPPVMA